MGRNESKIWKNWDKKWEGTSQQNMEELVQKMGRLGQNMARTELKSYGRTGYKYERTELKKYGRTDSKFEMAELSR